MEISDPATPDQAVKDATNRRKSGRAKTKPLLYQEDPNVSVASNGSGKRKRVPLGRRGYGGSDRDELGGSDEAEESDSEESEGEADEEELKEKRRRTAKSKKTQSKPVAKKPRTANANTTKLAMRPATNGVKVSKPRKPRAQHGAAIAGGTGLYGR